MNHRKYLLMFLLILTSVSFIVLFILSSFNRSNNIKEKPEPIQVSECQQKSNYYIGLSEQDAIAKADQENTIYHVTMRDGEGLSATMDYSPDRINFIITNNKIESVSCG